MNFQGARYYRSRVTGTASDPKLLLVCRNSKTSVRNGLRRCEGGVRFNAKIVKDQIEICTDQLIDYRRHADWCEFFATNAKLDKLVKTSTRKSSPRTSQKLSVKAVKTAVETSESSDDMKPQPRTHRLRRRGIRRSKMRDDLSDDLSDESDDAFVGYSADRSDSIAKEDSLVESSNRLLVGLNKLSSLLQELIDHPPNEEAKRSLKNKFGECGTKFEELSKSFVKTLDFLGARYRVGGDDSFVFGKDILVLACKNRHPSRGAENRCDSFLIFENNGETPNAIFRMNKFLMYSQHSASCEYSSSNSDLAEFYKSSKNLLRTGSDGHRPSEENRTEQGTSSNSRSTATVRPAKDHQSGEHQTRPSTAGPTIERKRKPDHAADRVADRVAHRAADDRPPAKRRDSKWSGDIEGSTFGTSLIRRR